MEQSGPDPKAYSKLADYRDACIKAGIVASPMAWRKAHGAKSGVREVEGEPQRRRGRRSNT